MKNILHILIISLLFSIHTTYPQELTDNEKIGIFFAGTAFCFSLCMAYFFKNDISNWLTILWKKIYDKQIYEVNYLQQDDQNQTLFYKAFMFQGLEDPNQFHFFQNLDSDQKKDFMFRELQIVANFTPKNIWGHSLWSIKKEDFETVKRFNSFIIACAQYGNIDLNKPFFFNIASQRAQARQDSFNSSARPTEIKLSIDISTECSKYWCMHKDKNICRRIFDEGHPDYQCADCKVLFPINEVIVHAFARHIKPIKVEQSIHKQVAIAYQDNPGDYYWKKQEEKELIKDAIRPV